MLIFGHVGITTGVVRIYEKAAKRKSGVNNNLIDYRIVMAGSLLPDIIDKPLVQIIYGLNDHEGHFIAHSFVFSALIIILGLIMPYFKGNKNVFLLGMCSLMHQLFDKLVISPNVFHLKNINLIKIKFVHNLITSEYIKTSYFRNVVFYLEKPYVFISEVLGFAIIVYFVCKLFINKGHMKFLKYGNLEVKG